MDQQQRRRESQRAQNRDGQLNDEAGGAGGSSDALRAEGQRLMEAADASLARAESIDRILDEELSRDSPQFLTSINQGSGQ